MNSHKRREVVFDELLGFHYVHVPGEGDPLFLLHGTGADEYDLLQLGAYLAPDAPIISARGRAPEGSVNRWFARFAPGVLDEEDVRRRADELAGFLMEVTARHGADPARLWAVGFSNGANMAAAMLLLHPAAFAGAILLRPMLPLQAEAPASLTGIPVYVASGTADTMIPRASTEELIATLEKSGADLSVNWEHAGHGLGQSELDKARSWLTSRMTPRG